MPTDKTYLYTLWQKVCTNNDQQAFQSLFELLYLRLVNFSMAYVHSREPAEEIVGDVFLKLWMNRVSTGEMIDRFLPLLRDAANSVKPLLL